MQPAMEREWATDPFEMQAIDGYLYGRGTSDNKVQPGASGLRLARLHAASVLSGVQPPEAHPLTAPALSGGWRLQWPQHDACSTAPGFA